MKHLKKILTPTGLGLACLLASSAPAWATQAPTAVTAATTTTTATAKQPTTNIQLFFSITARSGSVSPIMNKPGAYQLTLNNVNPYAIYFSDVPNRISGLVEISRFAQQWQDGKNSFKDNPPNGNLTAVTSKSVSSNETLSLVFALTNPVYNSQTRTLTFQADATHDEFPLQKPITFKNLALFIDGLNIQGVCFGCVH